MLRHCGGWLHTRCRCVCQWVTLVGDATFLASREAINRSINERVKLGGVFCNEAGRAAWWGLAGGLRLAVPKKPFCRNSSNPPPKSLITTATIPHSHRYSFSKILTTITIDHI